MPIFGDIDWSGVTINIILTAFGGAVVWVVSEVRKSRKDRREEVKDDEKTTIDRYKELYERQEQDKRECREDVNRLEGQVTELRDKVLVLTVSVVRAVGWIKYQEGLLRVNNVPHEPWTDELPQAPKPPIKSEPSPP